VKLPLFAYRHQHPDPVVDAPAVMARALDLRYAAAGSLALEGLTHDVRVGARVALVGPNGSGKSTLIKAIAGLLPACGGELRIFGWPAGSCRHRVAYLPQRPAIDWRFPISLRRLVLTGRYVHLGWMRRPDAADFERVDAALEDLGLYQVRDRQIGELSGGQQQRALLARALVQEADLLLLDEPLNHVDAATADEVNLVLDRLRAEGKTVIVSTHDLDEFAGGFDDLICLVDGRPVSAQGRSLDELREQVWTG
jgi:manganese/zinc/iron transport system ATP- binding protein